MMLGLLLARAGVDVLVLEKHADFLRDFRGDTIHPSTLELMHELGLLDRFLELPHQRIEVLYGQVGAERLAIADFSRLHTHARFMALMPQWDFLTFLMQAARDYPAFELRMEAEVTGLLEEAGRVVGVRAETAEGALAVRADLVIAADGRHSLLRDAAGLPAMNLGAPMDALWFRLPREEDDPMDTMGNFQAGRIGVFLNRGTYWQCALVIPKDGYEALRARGLAALRQEIVRLAPFAADRVEELQDWEAIKLLTVRVDRLQRWFRPGLLCIGDAAHAMSPIGGVGVNLAIQDAVAAANLLAEPLRTRTLTLESLARVQQRRMLPTRVTQRLQLAIQDRIISPVLARSEAVTPPLLLRLIARSGVLRGLTARLIGIGIRPEHITTRAIVEL